MYIEKGRGYARGEKIIEEDDDFVSARSMVVVMMKKKGAMKAERKKIE